MFVIIAYTSGIQSFAQLLNLKMENITWRNELCCMGIDEAGRGPVIGPMVYACAVARWSLKDDIRSRGFDDSKALTEEKRELLFKLIQADPDIAYAIESLSAKEISGRMLSRGRTSLNVLAEEATCRLIQKYIESGFQLKEVFIDTVGDPERYAARLSQRFPGVDFTVCPKADALYPIVSAASIVAKVTRDRAVAEFEASMSLPDEVTGEAGGSRPSKRMKLGSGYPGDPDTKAWLQNNIDKVFGYPDIVRFSWDTCTRYDGSVRRLMVGMLAKHVFHLPA